MASENTTAGMKKRDSSEFGSVRSLERSAKRMKKDGSAVVEAEEGSIKNSSENGKKLSVKDVGSDKKKNRLAVKAAEEDLIKKSEKVEDAGSDKKKKKKKKKTADVEVKKLESKIMKRTQAREQQEGEQSRYIPVASRAIFNILKNMPVNHLYEDDDLELRRKISNNLVTKETFIEMLAKSVEDVGSSKKTKTADAKDVKAAEKDLIKKSEKVEDAGSDKKKKKKKKKTADVEDVKAAEKDLIKKSEKVEDAGSDKKKKKKKKKTADVEVKQPIVDVSESDSDAVYNIMKAMSENVPYTNADVDRLKKLANDKKLLKEVYNMLDDEETFLETLLKQVEYDMKHGRK